MKSLKGSPITHQRVTQKYRVIEEVNKRGFSSFYPEKKIFGLFWFPISLIAFYRLDEAWDFIDNKYKSRVIKHYR